jgi:PII-like signaling protein
MVKGPSMCVELIDKKEKLEQFFLKHKDLLHSKIVIYKEVEFWDMD